jgi:hypothetical protein
VVFFFRGGDWWEEVYKREMKGCKVNMEMSI